MILEFQVMVKECTWLAEAWLIVQVRRGRICSFSSTYTPAFTDTWYMVLLCGFQAIADVVIAMYMCILLRRRRTGFPKCVS
jgi:hypothetical protein